MPCCYANSLDNIFWLNSAKRITECFREHWLKKVNAVSKKKNNKKKIKIKKNKQIKHKKIKK